MTKDVTLSQNVNRSHIQYSKKKNKAVYSLIDQTKRNFPSLLEPRGLLYKVRGFILFTLIWLTDYYASKVI